MVFCFCRFGESMPPFSGADLNYREQFGLGARLHCPDLPTQMQRSRLSRCMLPLPSTELQRALPRGWSPRELGTEQTQAPTGTLPWALGSASIKFNDIMCLIFLTTTLCNWGWQDISLKSLKHVIFLYKIVHGLNTKHLADPFKIQISLNSEPTIVWVAIHLIKYTHVTYTSNIYLFLYRCIYIGTHLYTRSHSLNLLFQKQRVRT